MSSARGHRLEFAEELACCLHVRADYLHCGAGGGWPQDGLQGGAARSVIVPVLNATGQRAVAIFSEQTDSHMGVLTLCRCKTAHSGTILQRRRLNDAVKVAHDSPTQDASHDKQPMSRQEYSRLPMRWSRRRTERKKLNRLIRK